MLAISKDNREVIERQYICLLMHKPELLKINQIKSKYLKSDVNKKILDAISYCYEKYGVINFIKIAEMKLDVDYDECIDIYDNEFYYNEAFNEQKELSEESIIKFYKQDIIKNINEKLKKNEINYEDFMNQMKKLDEIKINKESNYLTIEEIDNNISNGKIINFNNYEKLSTTLKLTEGDLLVIGSMTGTGKTGFMLNLMSDLMNNYQCIYFNIEMSKPNIYKRILAINSNLTIREIEKPEKGIYEESVLKTAKQKLENCKVIIEHQTNKIQDIRRIIANRKDKSRHTIIFIDHLGLTRIDNKIGLYEQMTEIMKELRNICLDYGCTIIGASQLNRTAYTSDELTVSMLKDSGELENSARKIILLSRDASSSKEEPVNLMKVEIAKNDNGGTGLLYMRYDKTRQIFKEEKRK